MSLFNTPGINLLFSKSSRNKLGKVLQKYSEIKNYAKSFRLTATP